jgi:hypothetical protein
MAIELNSEPVKYAVIALSAPVWLPFAKALWREFNDALRDEGGILGAAPSAAELAAIERERGRFTSGMVSVSWEEQERLDSGGQLDTPTRTPSASLPRARGFRQR